MLVGIPLSLLGTLVAVTTLVVDLLASPLLPWLRARVGPEPSPMAAMRTGGAISSAVVVLTYDGIDYLRALLPTLEAAIAATPGHHRLLVVDNGSTDGTAAMLTAEFRTQSS